MKKLVFFGKFLFLSIAGLSQFLSLTRWVDAFIGAEYGDNFFVGAVVPFCMERDGFDCGGNHNNSGYYREKPVNICWHTHVGDTGGFSGFGNVLVLPLAGSWQLGNISYGRLNESAGGGIYAAFHIRYAVNAGVTSMQNDRLLGYIFKAYCTKSI